MHGTNTEYKDTLKGIGIFGGVQVFLILAGVIKNKVLAVLIGPEGIGVIGIYNNTLNFIATITAFGIGFSAIRDIAAANEQSNELEIKKTIATTNRWVWLTGLFGLILTLVLSPFLSKISFGNDTYTFAFAWLSITLLFNSINSGHIAILRGCGRRRSVANATLWGSIAGLMLSLPLYYYFRLKGIVPSICVTSVAIMLCSWLFIKKERIGEIKIGIKEAFTRGLGMAKLGTMMTISNMVGQFCTYMIIMYISNKGGLKQVGLYQTGWSLVVTYTNMILISIAADYFPRLAAVNRSNLKVNELANQQGEILMLLLGPLIAGMIIFIPQIIQLFYSKEFLDVVVYSSFLLFGTLIHAATIIIGYIFMAKGDSFRHLVNEVGIKTNILPLTLFGYFLGGIEGIGVAFIVSNIVSFSALYTRAKRFYDFSYNREFIKIFTIQIISCCAILALIMFSTGLPKFVSVSLIGCSVTIYSIHELNKRINLKLVIKTLMSRVLKNKTK